MIRRSFLAGLIALVAAPLAAAEPQRIVVAGGDLTEIVFALGLGDRVVAVDSTSRYPVEVTDLAQIGYVRRLAPEGILALTPDLLVVAHDAGPDIALERIEAAGVEVLRAPEGNSPGGVVAKMRALGAALDRKAEASALVEDFEAEMAEVTAAVAKIETAPRVLFVLTMQGNLPLVAGRDTGASTIIGLAGGTNVATGFEGYVPLSREGVIAGAPEVLLMMEGHAGRIGGMEEILRRPEFAATPAGRDGRGIQMDGPLLLGFGPRTPEAVRMLARALHGDAATAAGL